MVWRDTVCLGGQGASEDMTVEAACIPEDGEADKLWPEPGLSYNP